jgi:aspartate kinase
MSIIVQKYGGTSVGSVERMRHVADLVIAERNAGHQVVVVASAMAGATNHLVNSAQQFSNAAGTPAYDFVISTGENVSCGMLALALAERGVNAIPMAGWQVPIKTNELHSKARIVDVETTYLHQLLRSGIIPVITGFQGMGPDQRLTTLGRGGSDTSAVAIAAALKAKRCDIYTDIDGIYTADPRVVADARFISEVSYDVAFQMATLGTKIIHPRAVDCGKQSRVPLRILSSFGSDKFTLISNCAIESNVTGIAHTHNNVLYKVSTNNSSKIKDILGALHDLDVPVDMITQANGGLQLCAEFSDEKIIKDVLASFNVTGVKIACSKISAVGVFAHNYLNHILQTLKAQNITVIYNCIDNARISVLVSKDQMELVVNTLHAFFLSSSSKRVDL